MQIRTLFSPGELRRIVNLKTQLRQSINRHRIQIDRVVFKKSKSEVVNLKEHKAAYKARVEGK